MAEKEVDALLERMSKIATAVNAFKSESVQQAALAALVSAFETGAVHRQKSVPAAAERLDEVEAVDEGNGVAAPTKRRRRAKGSGSVGASTEKIQPVRDLDLRPKGRESFDDFIATKQPHDNQEKFTVAIFYLEQIAKISPITLGHVGAVFRQTKGWREPGNLRSGVRMTAHRKNWLDTSDMTNLRTTAHGRNFVEHDLPAQPKKK